MFTFWQIAKNSYSLINVPFLKVIFTIFFSDKIQIDQYLHRHANHIFRPICTFIFTSPNDCLATGFLHNI